MVKVTNENNYYYRSSPFALYGNNIDRFFKLLDGRTFKVNDIYTFDSIHRENPYITHLNKKTITITLPLKNQKPNRTK